MNLRGSTNVKMIARIIAINTIGWIIDELTPPPYAGASGVIGVTD